MKARSAVQSVSTSGVLVTTTPRVRAAAASMWSKPTLVVATMRTWSGSRAIAAASSLILGPMTSAFGAMLRRGAQRGVGVQVLLREEGVELAPGPLRHGLRHAAEHRDPRLAHRALPHRDRIGGAVARPMLDLATYQACGTAPPGALIGAMDRFLFPCSPGLFPLSPKIGNPVRRSIG